MQSAKLEEIIGKIETKNPLHGKKLRKSLSNLDSAFYEEAEAFFSNYERFATNNDKDLDYGIDSYLKMIADMMYEYVNFVRTGEYTCKSFDDAYERVYNNPDIMEYYMHGLIMSQFLWRHHYAILQFFENTLKKYSSTNYLEIGGGHGLYLSKAMDIFGSGSTYQMCDISKSSLEMARNFINNPSVNYTLQDIYEYKPDQLFDFITMGEVLEHVEDPVSLLKALGALLTDDGVCFITTPTNAPAIDHIYLFRNQKEIEDLIENAGFEILESVGVYSEDVTDEVGAKRNIALLYGAFIKKK